MKIEGNTEGDTKILLDIVCKYSMSFPRRYADLIDKAQERHANLEESMKKNAMLREAKEIESWMLDAVSGFLLLW